MRNNAFLAAVVVGITLLAGGVFAADPPVKTITDRGIRVSCPPALEAQAKKVLQILDSQVSDSIGFHRQLIALLEDSEGIGTEVSEALAAPEKQDNIAARLRGYRDSSLAMTKCFSNVRLVQQTDVMATEGLDAGAVHLRYDRDEHEFRMNLDMLNITEETLEKTWFPVIVTADGSIRSQDKLKNIALEFLGTSQPIAVMPVHETVSYVLVQELKVYDPLTRWFNEGVSGWLASRVISKRSAELGRLFEGVIRVSDGSKELRPKVNLPAWRQKAYQNLQQGHIVPAMEAACTQYSIELIGKLFGSKPADLPRVMSDLNYNSAIDTALVCDTISKNTGKDAKSLLLEYVPDDVRRGLESGEPEKLLAEAKELALQKKWSEAADRVRAALSMTPQDVNARLNYAWLQREIGEDMDSELQVFLAANLLKRGNYSFKLFASSIEGNYVSARLSMLMGNIEYARKFLEPVLAYNPDHEDGKKLMEAIVTVEKAVGGRIEQRTRKPE